jgi:hypothetical protein
MITEELAVATLYMIVNKAPYRTTSSWVQTQDYTNNTMLQHSRTSEQFVMDERFARPVTYKNK